MTNWRDIEKALSALEEDVDTAPELEVVIRDSLVMSRERAEREGREILGPSEEAAREGFVKVPVETKRYQI